MKAAVECHNDNYEKKSNDSGILEHGSLCVLSSLYSASIVYSRN